jgi:hypothetical protein
MNYIIPPPAIIKTWLQLASSNTVELEIAKCMAIKNLINVFGNIDIAQVYYEQHYEKTDKFQHGA